MAISTRLGLLLVICLGFLAPAVALADCDVKPGTIITKQNWTQYKDCFPRTGNNAYGRAICSGRCLMTPRSTSARRINGRCPSPTWRRPRNTVRRPGW